METHDQLSIMVIMPCYLLCLRHIVHTLNFSPSFGKQCHTEIKMIDALGFPLNNLLLRAEYPFKQHNHIRYHKGRFNENITPGHDIPQWTL